MRFIKITTLDLYLSIFKLYELSNFILYISQEKDNNNLGVLFFKKFVKEIILILFSIK